MIPTPVQFKGAPGSPYTRKMLALLRYRHIPYEFLIGNQADELGLPEPKVNLLPTFYLPNEAGQIEAVVDSTPLIRRFESEFEARSVLPGNPVLNFINYLLEDYGDEWLTKAMFHYRWYYDADIDRAGKILPLWRNLDLSPDDHRKAAKNVSDRQIARLYVVGSNDITAPVIEDSYKRFLSIMDSLIQQQPFLMGERPGSSDFAFYAQLTQLARFDPTPEHICIEQAPRVFAWTDVMDDLTGCVVEDSDWIATADIQNVLGDLLTEVGRVYAPFLLANGKALMAGEQHFETTIDGRKWAQPTFPYQGKCLQWIKQEFSALADSDKQQVAEILKGTGCEALLN